MNGTYNKKLVPNAQKLRKNMTKEERHLWYDFLKDLPVMVHRQKVIGPYIVDFYIAEKKVVIEIDGRQHLMDDNKESDKLRDKKLSEWGISVIRIPNKALNNDFKKVCDWLLTKLDIDVSELK